MMILPPILQTAPAREETDAKTETNTTIEMIEDIDQDRRIDGGIGADQGRGQARREIGATRQRKITEGTKMEAEMAQRKDGTRSGVRAETSTDRGEVCTSP